MGCKNLVWHRCGRGPSHGRTRVLATFAIRGFVLALEARGCQESLADGESSQNTPIAGLKISAQVLQRRGERGLLPPERLAAGLGHIVRSAERLATLVNDLLDVSRLRTGQLPIARGPVDVASLLREAVDRAREHHGETHRITLDATAGLGTVRGDAVRLDQVLLNLLDNAVKYSPRGGEVAVVAREDRGRVRVTVRDEGIGLPPGSEEAIFAPFGRTANAERHQIPGLGLGLHICRAIVERHGGEIRAESAGEDRGTTVHLWLPADGAAADAAEDG